MNYLFLLLLNLLLPLIGYGIAGRDSMILMVVMVAIFDYVAVCEPFKMRGDSEKYR
jgi:hypothetical protein